MLVNWVQEPLQKGVMCQKRKRYWTSGEQEGKSNAEEEERGSPGRRNVGLVSNSGELVRVEDLMRALTITTGRGLQPPTLEGKRVSREFVKKFLPNHQEYASRMKDP